MLGTTGVIILGTNFWTGWFISWTVSLQNLERMSVPCCTITSGASPGSGKISRASFHILAIISHVICLEKTRVLPLFKEEINLDMRLNVIGSVWIIAGAWVTNSIIFIPGGKQILY